MKGFITSTDQMPLLSHCYEWNSNCHIRINECRHSEIITEHGLENINELFIYDVSRSEL
jgi:hypothetical protein